MGTFTHNITLIATSGDARESFEALVDTGATFTSVPASLLERLGVQAERVVRLELANGQIEERPIGPVKVELDGRQRTVSCVFGESGEPSVMGATTLEVFLLSVGPVGRKLAPIVGYRLEQETL